MKTDYIVKSLTVTLEKCSIVKKKLMISKFISEERPSLVVISKLLSWYAEQEKKELKKELVNKLEDL
jgi:hypothetical protein